MCEVESSVLILVVKKLSVLILIYLFFQMILDCSNGDYSEINKTICCQYIPCLFAFYNVVFVSFVSFHVFSCLFSPCLFMCEVQSSVLILVVKKLSVLILIYFFFQLILAGSKDKLCQYVSCLFAFYNVVFVYFLCLFVSFHVFPLRVFSCLSLSPDPPYPAPHPTNSRRGPHPREQSSASPCPLPDLPPSGGEDGCGQGSQRPAGPSQGGTPRPK